ncbi:VWA domain-containing protein [Sutcliffiella cohnii]|nr:VWA domain-containing protein [Sutcliffiella cohnii]
MLFQVEKPLMLLLLLPSIVSLVFFLKIKMKKGVKEYTILTLRTFVYLLLILALSVPQLLYPVQGLHTIFIVDQSESVKRVENEMLKAVNTAVASKGKEDAVAVATLANKTTLERAFSTEPGKLSSVSKNDETYFTNLEEGLTFASQYIPPDAKGRVVLLTDGVETSGNVLSQAEILAAKNVEVDVIPFQPAHVKDVLISNFTTPKSGFVGETIPLTIAVESNVDSEGELIVTQNNETVIRERVAIAEGRNYFAYQVPLQQTGMYTFKAEIIAESDEVVENNLSYAITNVSGEPRVLVVHNDGNGQNIYDSLQTSGWNVDQVSSELLPTSLAGFLQYDSILFHNVSAHHLSESQMNMMETAVRDFGVGFVMTGGNESFGLGGYFKTPIERILPVDMDVKGKKEIPSLGLVIVLDRSGSMMGEKFDLAKEAAARSVELLREEDTFGFIAFDTEPWIVVETEPIENKAEVMETIRSTPLGGGTEIYTALQLGYEQLVDLPLKRKHIILLTDGVSPHGDYESLIEEGLENNVTLSTVAIGGDADRSLLEELAEYGTGRYYDVIDASSVPSILSRETALTTKTYIEDNPHYPSIVGGYDWSRHFTEGVPSLNAYIATTIKQRAEELVISEKDDPVLARMNYGIGRTVAWTSDVTGAWSGDWPAWTGWSSLWNEIVTWSLPSFESGQYDVHQSITDGKATVNIEALEDPFMPLQVVVSSNDGEVVEAITKQTGPGQYEVTFPALPNMYFLTVSQGDNDVPINTYSTGIVVPYSTEFEQKPMNALLMEQLTTMTGGKVLEEPVEAFRDWNGNVYRTQTVITPFIVLAFLLFFLEVAIRRFGFTPLHKLGLLFRRKSKPEAKRSRVPKKTNPKSQKQEKAQAPIIEGSRDETLDWKEKKKVVTEKSEVSNDNQAERMARLLKAKNRRK